MNFSIRIRPISSQILGGERQTWRTTPPRQSIATTERSSWGRWNRTVLATHCWTLSILPRILNANVTHELKQVQIFNCISDIFVKYI
jgi:hypothetical protein